MTDFRFKSGTGESRKLSMFRQSKASEESTKSDWIGWGRLAVVMISKNPLMCGGLQMTEPSTVPPEPLPSPILGRMPPGVELEKNKASQLHMVLQPPFLSIPISLPIFHSTLAHNIKHK